MMHLSTDRTVNVLRRYFSRLNMISRLLFLISLSAIIICDVAVSTGSDLAELDFKDWSLVAFTESTYKAVINENGDFVMLSEPIILQNVEEEIGFHISSDNYEDYALYIHQDLEEKIIFVNLTIESANPLSKGIDIIFLQARDIEFNVVAKTIVFVFNSNSEFNPYKLKFSLGGTEYIVLNYHYFKWFLTLLTFSGLGILIIELHEVVKHFKRSGEHTVDYKELQNV